MKRVLFVDDERPLLDGLQDFFWKYRQHFDIAFALGGEKALAELRKAPFDVIVTDMRMPVMDGATLLQRVKDDYPSVVRIVLSGHAEQDAVFKALRVSHQFLAKPCPAEMLRDVIERACELKDILDNEALRRIVGRLEKLPSLPASYLELSRAMEAPEVTAQTIARIVEKDSAMCVKLLQLVNSAYFGLPKPLSRVDQTVVYLGIELIRSLVLVIHVFSAIERPSKCRGLSFQTLQQHAISTARVARRLVSDPKKASEAFTAALLHELGVSILAFSIPEQYRAIVEISRSESRILHAVEMELLGVTHAAVGAYLLGLWGLPHPIVEAVARHHDHQSLVQRTFDLPAVVSIADALVDDITTKDWKPTTSAIDMDSLEQMGVGSQLPMWRAIAAEEVRT